MSNINRTAHQAPSSSIRPQARPTVATDATRVQKTAAPSSQSASKATVSLDANKTRAHASANIEPTSFTMPEGMSKEAKEVYNAIKAYPKNLATDAQAKEMAVEIVAAAKAFGVDHKIMTAIIAQESQFKPNARSSTGAGGLGQLTNTAIDETRRIAGERKNSPFREHKAIFDRIDKSKSNRNNIKDNVWTTAAYTALMQERGKGSTKTMLQRYNGEPGRKESYPRGVGSNYNALWGTAMPTRTR